MDGRPPLYDDGKIRCEEHRLAIRWYYPWGTKHIRYTKIKALRSFRMTKVRGKLRIWGSGDLVHWFNLDTKRPRKNVAIEIRLHGRIRPTITPKDPKTVMRLLEAHTGLADESAR